MTTQLESRVAAADAAHGVCNARLRRCISLRFALRRTAGSRVPRSRNTQHRRRTSRHDHHPDPCDRLAAHQPVRAVQPHRGRGRAWGYRYRYRSCCWSQCRRRTALRVQPRVDAADAWYGWPLWRWTGSRRLGRIWRVWWIRRGGGDACSAC